MYKLIISIICIAVISTNANSQSKDSTKVTRNVHSVGMHASFLSGVGLSYRYWPSKLGVQVTVLPVFRKGNGHFLSFGLTALYTLKEGKTTDLYGYWGNHFISSKSSGNFGNSGSQSLNTGLGVGFKINFTDFFNLNIQGGYGLYDVTDSFYSTIAGGAGLYFSF
jgi:hypothetical protein